MPFYNRDFINTRSSISKAVIKAVNKCHLSFSLYIKTTLTKNMPTDIREYHFKNSMFPNQTTADQFFDENQFESYRKLGYHALDGVKVF